MYAQKKRAEQLDERLYQGEQIMITLVRLLFGAKSFQRKNAMQRLQHLEILQV